MSAKPGAQAVSLIASFAAGWTKWLGDLVFPSVCPGCSVVTGTHRAFCPSCWSEIRFIERPFCDVLGLPFSYDPGPGMLSAEAIANPPVFDRLRSSVIFEGRARDLVHALKYRDRTDLAPMMAGWMLRAAEGHLTNCDGTNASILFCKRSESACQQTILRVAFEYAVADVTNEELEAFLRLALVTLPEQSDV